MKESDETGRVTIAYRAAAWPTRTLLVVAVLLLLGLLSASCLHATKLTCTAGDVCVVSRHALYVHGQRRVDVPMRDIVELRSETRRTPKGFTYAAAWFQTRGGDVDLGGDTLDGGKLSIDSVRDAVVAFDDFRSTGKTRLEVWLHVSVITAVFVSLVTLALVTVAGLVVRGVLRGVAPIRIVVDRAAGVVIVPAAKRELSIANIVGVELDEGARVEDAQTGWRVAFAMRSGHREPATDDFRPMKERHEDAIEALRRALGVGASPKAETKKAKRKRR